MYDSSGMSQMIEQQLMDAVQQSELSAQSQDPNQTIEFDKLVDSINPDVNKTGESGFMWMQNSTPDPSLGEALLKGMSNMKQNIDVDFERLWEMGNDLSNQSEITPGDIIMLQVQATTFGFELQLSGTIVNKSTQHIDTFLKSQ